MYFTFKEIELDVYIDFPGITVTLKKWTLEIRFLSFDSRLNPHMFVESNTHVTSTNPFISLHKIYELKIAFLKWDEIIESLKFRV